MFQGHSLEKQQRSLHTGLLLDSKGRLTELHFFVLNFVKACTHACKVNQIILIK